LDERQTGDWFQPLTIYKYKSKPGLALRVNTFFYLFIKRRCCRKCHEYRNYRDYHICSQGWNLNCRCWLDRSLQHR